MKKEFELRELPNFFLLENHCHDPNGKQLQRINSGRSLRSLTGRAQGMLGLYLLVGSAPYVVITAGEKQLKTATSWYLTSKFLYQIFTDRFHDASG